MSHASKHRSHKHHSQGEHGRAHHDEHDDHEADEGAQQIAGRIEDWATGAGTERHLTVSKGESKGVEVGMIGTLEMHEGFTTTCVVDRVTKRESFVTCDIPGKHYAKHTYEDRVIFQRGGFAED